MYRREGRERKVRLTLARRCREGSAFYGNARRAKGGVLTERVELDPDLDGIRFYIRRGHPSIRARHPTVIIK